LAYVPAPAPSPVPAPVQAAPAPATAVAPAIEPDEDDYLEESDEPEDREPEETIPAAVEIAPPPPPPNPDSGLPEQVEPAEVDSEDEIVSAGLFDQDVPLILIAGREIPLFAPLGSAAWALVNLVLCILGVAFAVVSTVLALIHRRERAGSAKAERMYNNASASVAAGSVGAAPTRANSSNAEKEKWNNRQQLGWLVAAVILAIAGVITFLLTQSMRHPMVLVDIWTILHVIFLAAEAIAVMLVFDIAKEVVTFETRGKDSFKKKVRNGKSMDEPKPPVRRGQTFAGWYTDDQHTVRWNFNDKIDRNLTLYAKWKRAPQQ